MPRKKTYDKPDKYTPEEKRVGPPSDKEEEEAASPSGLPIREMSVAGSEYTWEQKASACMAYCVTGNGAKASRLCGVPSGTLLHWRRAAPWWLQAVASCRKQLQDKFDSKITGIMDSLLTNIAEKVENGEQVFNHQAGEMVARTIPAKDQATIFGILHDKRALMRGDATVIRQGGTDDMLKKLENRMEKFAKTIKEDRVVSSQ